MVDLTGKRFGNLTVVSYANNYKWNCLCDCGTNKTIRGGDLQAGKTKSCGCLKKKMLHDKRVLDLTNQRFGRLTVEYEANINKKGVYWVCTCDCGNETIVKSSYLISGDTKSCGCLKNDTIQNLTKTHGKSKTTRLYNVWKGMRQRCNNINSSAYHNYGGRGIRICPAWNDFQEFYEWAIHNGYDDNEQAKYCSIERVDVNGDYCPENCKWVTRKQQANNTRRNHHLTFNGQTRTISEWEDVTGIPQKVIWNRIEKCNWTVDKALTEEVRSRGCGRNT